ncbi:MAG: TldD protein, partial [Gammaproteobacteria bacterium]
AALDDLGESAAGSAAERAVQLARSLGGARTRAVELASKADGVGEFRTPVEIDPFEVPLADKLDLLAAAEESLAGAEHVVAREASLRSRSEEQWFASSEGAAQYQHLLRTGAGISATAAKNGIVQRRSWPASFGGNYRAGGWEHILGMDLASHGQRIRDEAVLLCEADVCPAGERDLILMGNQLMLQIHESVGHPNELDRVYGEEVDLAGSSFALPEMVDSFQYGSEHVNLVADSTIPGGLDTRGWDDDGIASGRWNVVEKGIFRGYHTSREWAARGGPGALLHPASRAEGWFNMPIVRITNLSLMPGSWKLEDLVADTEDGVICDTVKMWSIDQRRLNFQFTTELAWEIKNGKRTRMLRNPTYQGTTPTFWRSCDAICDESHWDLWGVINCGKGNPVQTAEMSHGASPARFRGVTFVA